MKLFIAAICLVFASTSAQAAKHKRHRAIQVEQTCAMDNNGRSVCHVVSDPVFGGTVGTVRVQSKRPAVARAGRVSPVSDRLAEAGPDPRPHAWCAWWLRRYLHIAKSEFPRGAYNLARSFAQIGRPAEKGCIDCIAVFSRGRGGHVGIVKSWDANGNPVILSGNFNGGVGVGAHSASRLIALRWHS